MQLLTLCIRSAGIAVLVCILLVLSVYGIIRSTFDGTAVLPADCAVVFGAAVYGQSLPGPAITRRIAAAADLFKNKQVNRLFLSGGKGSGVRESEASVMRAYALELGVPRSVIFIEDQSHSTWENIANVRNLTVDCTSVVGVSDQYHLARIELIAWRQGWGELATVPAQQRPPVESEKKSVCREVFAYLYYLFYLDMFFPDLPARYTEILPHNALALLK